MKKVSVIVPIYKVEKYLKYCVDSICKQTYANLEIILIDDGSPDSCGELCDAYAKEDSRIKVVHKQNQGLGKARNTGLDNATGDFVCFVDSDDWLVPTAIEKWMQVQQQYNSDIVMCNYDKYNDSGNSLYQYRIVDTLKIYSGEELEEKIFWQMIGRSSDVSEDYTINMCVWTNIYKKSIIDKSNIRFMSEREYLSEDICFNLQYLLECQKAVMIPDSLYRYRYNPESLTNHYKGDEFQKACRLYEKVKYWADCAQYQKYREFRVERFFITKVRELMFRLCGSNLKYSEKIAVTRNILSSREIKSTLRRYPISSYKIKYRVPAILMKTNMVHLTVILFAVMGKRR